MGTNPSSSTVQYRTPDGISTMNLRKIIPPPGGTTVRDARTWPIEDVADQEELAVMRQLTTPKKDRGNDQVGRLGIKNHGLARVAHRARPAHRGAGLGG